MTEGQLPRQEHAAELLGVELRSQPWRMDSYLHDGGGRGGRRGGDRGRLWPGHLHRDALQSGEDLLVHGITVQHRLLELLEVVGLHALISALANGQVPVLDHHAVAEPILRLKAQLHQSHSAGDVLPTLLVLCALQQCDSLSQLTGL